MAKEILYKGEKYSVNLNMLVFEKWEEYAGMKFSEIGTLLADTGSLASVRKALALLYFGLEDSWAENNQETAFTFDNFLRSIDLFDETALANMFSLVVGDGAENKGQPTKKPTKK